MPFVDYAARDEIVSEKMLDRLMSLGSRTAIALARENGLDDVVPAGLAPSARAYVDPVSGKVFSRRSVQEAKSFYVGPLALRFRSLSEVTNEKVAREKILDEAGLTFPARDWTARHERDLKAAAIERAYKSRQRRTGKPIGKLYAEGSEFRAALARLSDPTPPGTKAWSHMHAQVKKTRALETLGLRPRGFAPLTGTYTRAELAAAWRAAGVRRPPQLVFQYKKTRTR